MMNILNYLSVLEDVQRTDNNGAIIGAIVAAVFGGIALVVILYFIFNKIYFAKKRCKKALKDLEKKYEYLHALLTGQDAQYIQRLEMISRTNLLYVDMHSSFFKRSKEIRDTTDITFQDILTELGTYFEENKIKEFKTYLKEHVGLIKQYENSVNQLNNDLIQIIKPEEECREAAVTLKEALRECKSKYNLNEEHLQFVSMSFERVFDAIDHNFNEFDSLVETANYDDANKLLPAIDKVVKLLDKLIDEIPDFIKEFTIDIPNRVNELNNRYKELLDEKKPLAHLNVENKVAAINDETERCVELIKKLTVASLPESSKKINGEIDEILNSFDKEVKASEDFANKKEKVLKTFANYEQEYIKITHSIDKFRKVYVVDEAHEDALKQLRVQSDSVSHDKRSLDVYVLSLNGSPYTVLIEKINILEKGTKEFGDKVDEFRNYLSSLKNDSESAFKNLKVRYMQLKKAEATIRDWRIDSFIENYKPRFDSCYDLIDKCHSVLETVPIDVSEVNSLTNQLNEAVNNLIKEVQEKNMYKEKASEQILLANRDRMKFAEVNNQLQQCETLYFNGNFKSAYELSDSIIKKLNNRDGK